MVISLSEYLSLRAKRRIDKEEQAKRNVQLAVAVTLLMMEVGHGR